MDKGIPIRAFYDSSDATGIHLSYKGADMLADSFQDFFNCGHISDDEFCNTKHTKTKLQCVFKHTPTFDKQVTKTNKLSK